MDASAKLPLVSAIGETSTTSGCVAEPKSECIQPPMTLWKSIPARKMSEATPVRGMRLLYNNVTIEDHSTSPRKVTVGGASFEVQPGYLVLVVGARGSGKTALIEPLIGLSQPASGEIFIDNIPLSSNRMGTYADEMTFHTQHREQVYPLSILENVMWGHGGVRDQALAEELAADVGCQRLLATNGIVGLPFSIYQSFGQGLMGTRTSAAMAQARPMLEEKFSINLTPTEEQRLTAARMLYRLHQGHTRLLVLDEPMHNLTATEESEVICKFLASKGGVTTIIVSKRFKEIAPLADLILCMDNGRIAQHGTHEQLIGKMEGTYANLYNAL
ncbi:hypothetical protein H0H87_011680 [Tephrocybe sp. NHM501043]|nr:hypothetical protein H0H87_011680 [Tephrocybe sp. NHM501043]